MASADETIAAIATPAGRGGVAIVRVSGPQAPIIARRLVARDLPPRRAVFCRFSGLDGEIVDEGLAILFPAPHSFTGDSVLELHGHGGDMAPRAVLEACLAAGARLAEPGEFTRRAYLNDRIDLAQAEGVADLIDARTRAAARSALRSLRGEFSAAVHELLNDLTELRALLEAGLDFPEEEIDILASSDALDRLGRLCAAVDRLQRQARQGNLLRDGLQLVIAGRPNAGKSSLLNSLAEEEIAIVTDVPGTTRDLIRQAIEIKGIPVNVVDTAGVRVSADPVERIGMARTHTALTAADVVLLIVDATAGYTDADVAIRAGSGGDAHWILVMNKIDMSGEAPGRFAMDGMPAVRLSAKSGAGLDLLRDAIAEAVGWSGGDEGVYLARARHLAALAEVSNHLAAARDNRAGIELMAEELRLAQRALSAVTGAFTADDLLGAIFSRFCIGK
jgi:tRNA modification GTPase